MKLNEHLLDLGLVRGGEIAARLGLTAVRIEWEGTTVTAWPLADVEAIIDRLAKDPA